MTYSSDRMRSDRVVHLKLLYYYYCYCYYFFYFCSLLATHLFYCLVQVESETGLSLYIRDAPNPNFEAAE